MYLFIPIHKYIGTEYDIFIHSLHSFIKMSIRYQKLPFLISREIGVLGVSKWYMKKGSKIDGYGHIDQKKGQKPDQCWEVLWEKMNVVPKISLISFSKVHFAQKQVPKRG